MFEPRRAKLVPFHVFFRRLIISTSVALLVMGISLAIGVVGYHAVAHLPWIDALLNASMILGGMGPVDPLPNPAAKIFASAYALYSGLILIATVGIALGPIIHRVLHRFHIDDADLEEDQDKIANRRSR